MPAKSEKLQRLAKAQPYGDTIITARRKLSEGAEPAIDVVRARLPGEEAEIFWLKDSDPFYGHSPLGALALNGNGQAETPATIEILGVSKRLDGLSFSLGEVIKGLIEVKELSEIVVEGTNLTKDVLIAAGATAIESGALGFREPHASSAQQLQAA